MNSTARSATPSKAPAAPGLNLVLDLVSFLVRTNTRYTILLALSASCLTNPAPKLIHDPSAHVDHDFRTCTCEEVYVDSFSPSYSRILNLLSPFADPCGHSFGRLYYVPPWTSTDHASDSCHHFSAPVSGLAYPPIGARAVHPASIVILCISPAVKSAPNFEPPLVTPLWCEALF